MTTIKPQVQGGTPISQTTNPFVNRSEPIGPYELFKLIVLGIFLAPLRMLLVVIVAAIYLIAAYIGTSFLSKEEKEGTAPFSIWRQRLLYPCTLAPRIAMFAFGYYYIKEVGTPAPRSEAPISVAANHRTFLDSWFFVAKFQCSFVAKASVANWPVFGTLARSQQALFVKREHTAAKGVICSITQRSHSTDPRWPKIFIFPESTCNNGTCMMSFKRGAFVPGVPVQPIVFKFPFKHFDPSWVPIGPSLGALVFRTLCQFKNDMEVHYLPVYYPTEEEKAHPDLYAENVRNYMAQYANLPTTYHSYEEFVLLKTALKEHLSPTAVETFSLHQIQSICKLDLTQAKGLLQRYKEIDVKGDGLLDAEEFAKLLGVPYSEYTNEIFQLFDKNQTGLIDFKQFILGLALLSQQCPPKGALELAFRTLDSSGRGYISATDLYLILKMCFPEITPMEIRDMFDRIDQDRDGFITCEEFVNYASSHPEFSLLMQHISYALHRSTSVGSSQFERLSTGKPNPRPLYQDAAQIIPQERLESQTD